MSRLEEATQVLEALEEELRRRGQDDLIPKLGHVRTLLGGTVLLSEAELLTTGEAARALGVHSINTVKRWARDGLLDGYRFGGRVMVSRASVAALRDSPTLAKQRAFERELDRALEPFEGASIGDEPHAAASTELTARARRAAEG